MKQQDFKIDFVGIGVEKSATTWIYNCLREHPEIFLPLKDNQKGSHFLNPKKEEREYYLSSLKKNKS